jgi:chromosome segregation ATPase
MSQRILVFEKNTTFVRELETGFGRLDAEVEVANDADTAVAEAKAGGVAMVLVSVDAMSAPGEAFLVCKRFKSDDDLARIPFVIMGGRGHAESFESHKKLKKRKADEYVELPTSFDKLLSQLRPILPFAVPATAENGNEPASERLDVDADIDAFADNAFDDLVLDDAPAPAPAAPAAHAVPAAPLTPVPDRGLEREVARLKAELEETKAQLSSAEERALWAERRAKTAEASRASVPPPAAAAGPSNRDLLELRERLNRKDKELLALRDEVTSRDRRLLEASDRSLELERAQAELQDSVSTLQQQLDDALEKAAGFEVELDATKKRRDEVGGRLARMEENIRSLERELDTSRAAHELELSERKALHEQQVRELEEQAAADAARLRADHAASVERLAAGHAEAIASLDARLRREVADAQAAHEAAISTLKNEHVEALQLAAQQREQALASQRNAADTALAAALARAEYEKADALAAAAAEHALKAEEKFKEAEAAKQQALDALRGELEARFAVQSKERDDRHNKELAVLGRKLSEADARAAALTQRISDVERSKVDLEETMLGRIAAIEADLVTRTEERDLTNNELAAARARVSAQEEIEANQQQQIKALDGALARAEQRIAQQSSKIANDDEILSRVRKALGISIGLLEQQKQS